MKVFWSWQSDHPGKVSRHFVREALEQAIAELRQGPDIEEAVREAHLDHDRKGVPGSPDLANIILEKIRSSDVFVADVTPVGHVSENPKKRLLNSNVAIELGYALSVLTDRALLMVLNEAYGTRDELPFDLRHKAGPISYRLPAQAMRKEIESEKAVLVGALKNALREIATSIPKKASRPFDEIIAPIDNPGRFFDIGEILVRSHNIDFKCTSEQLLYIRVIPTSAQPVLGRVEAMQAVSSSNLGVLNDRAEGWSKEQNTYGVIVFEGDHKSGEIQSATQLFKSREIWGFDAYMLSRQQAKRGIPTGWHEYMLANGLQKYVNFATQQLKVMPPLTAEIGLTNVSGYVLHMDRDQYWNPSWGPIQEQHVVSRKLLTKCSPAELDNVLLEAFQKIFDAAGTKRPEKYNNFPGIQPGSLPRR